MRGHDEARRREASVQRSRPEVGQSTFACKRRGVSMENLTAFTTSMGSASFAEIESTGSAEACAST